MTEHHHRSFVKGLSWRAVALVDTTILAFVFTGSIQSAFTISGLELFTKSFIFYFHERLWIWISRRFLAHDHADHRSGHGVSIAKSVSWRAFGTLDTTLLSFLVTGSVVTSLSIGGAEVVTKIVLYYLHERLWRRIGWGKRHHR